MVILLNFLPQVVQATRCLYLRLLATTRMVFVSVLQSLSNWRLSSAVSAVATTRFLSKEYFISFVFYKVDFWGFMEYHG